MASARPSNSLNVALPQRTLSSPARMPMSATPPEDTPPIVSPIDEDSTLAATIAEEKTTLEADVAEPDWKITIQNTDGTTSEVNLRQKEIRISMIADKRKQPEKSEKPVLSVTEKEVPMDDPEIKKAGKSREPIDPRKQRIWIIGQHALTASSSISIIAIMIVTLVTFHQNSNLEGAFPKNPLLSPTIVMLSIACLNVTADVVTLGIHFCHGKTAASAGRIVHHIRSVLTIIQAIGGATSAGYFKSAQSLSSGADIWGFCCSDAATAKFADMLCQSNSAAWALNILQVILHVLSFAMAIWTLFKPGQDLQTNLEEAKHLLSKEDIEDNKGGDVAKGK